LSCWKTRSFDTGTQEGKGWKKGREAYPFDKRIQARLQVGGFGGPRKTIGAKGLQRARKKKSTTTEDDENIYICGKQKPSIPIGECKTSSSHI